MADRTRREAETELARLGALEETLEVMKRLPRKGDGGSDPPPGK